MGQKINPIGLRIGISEPWRSRWYAQKKDFSALLIEEQVIRRFIDTNYRSAAISLVEVERTADMVHLILHTARPGIVIGRKGAEVERMRDEIQGLTGREVKIDIVEVTRPEINAQLVAQNICEQLEKRGGFRRAMKRAAEMAIEAGALGFKVNLAGRLAGSEMARRETHSEGSMPLQTLDTKIDYGFTEARTSYGRIGCKVWIYMGEQEKEPTHGDDAQKGEVSKVSAR